MKLYYGGDSHSASVLIALAEKGVEFESSFVDLATYEQHGEAFLAVNPAGQVPVLETSGHRLTESFFILLYLDERCPEPPLGGADPQARYLAQKWGKYVETHISPNLAIVAWSMRGRAPKERGFERLTPERRLLWQRACDGFSAVELETARAAVAKAVDRAEEDLANGPWLAGTEYTVADIAVFPHVIHARDLGFDMPSPVMDWLDRVASRPAVRASRRAATDVVTMGPERGRWG